MRELTEYEQVMAGIDLFHLWAMLQEHGATAANRFLSDLTGRITYPATDTEYAEFLDSGEILSHGLSEQATSY